MTIQEQITELTQTLGTAQELIKMKDLSSLFSFYRLNLPTEIKCNEEVFSSFVRRLNSKLKPFGFSVGKVKYGSIFYKGHFQLFLKRIDKTDQNHAVLSLLLDLESGQISHGFLQDFSDSLFQPLFAKANLLAPHIQKEMEKFVSYFADVLSLEEFLNPYGFTLDPNLKALCETHRTN